ncbi:MAG: phosphate uptake regulator PhoU [Promethearchaeati archaeon SRVP18_Atabeyarchaeia-1]
MNEVWTEKREVRKLQVTGDSTFILSLPKKWVTQMGLQKGSQVALITQNDNSLSIVPEGLRKPGGPMDALVGVEATDDPESIMRKIISLYLVGYNAISVREEKHRLPPGQRNAIKDVARRKLMGTEIIADSQNEITIKVLLSYTELSVQSALRRMSLIASSMHKDALSALKELDRESAKDVIDRDDEVDRFGLYIVRQLKAAVEDMNVLRGIGLTTGKECLAYRLITKFVERTADHAVEIARNITILEHFLDGQMFKKIESTSLAAVSAFDESIESLFKRDFRFAEEVVRKAKKVASLKKELMDSVLAETHIQEVAGLTLMIESIIRAAEYASDIAEIVMNLNTDQIVVAKRGSTPE